MVSIARFVVLWLIALAIPLQAMAAVVMPLCPAAQHGDVVAGAEPAALHQGAHGAPAASADQERSHGVPAHHVASHDDGAAGDGGGHSAQGMHKSCSVACSMAVLTAPHFASRAQAPSPAPLCPAAQFYRGVTLDGLDRPPKPVLA